MLRAFGLDIPQSLHDVCDPKRLALIVYDMQVGIVNQPTDPKSLPESDESSKPPVLRAFA